MGGETDTTCYHGGDMSETEGDSAVVTLSPGVEMAEKIRASINILTKFFLMILKCLVLGLFLIVGYI